MPRVAESRAPAEPVSRDQQARYRRILRAAAALGAESGYERVQMHEVAKEAGVAIATLYRYFPSKTHMFTALMGAQLDRLAEEVESAPAQDGVRAVVDLLVRASKRLLATPMLAQAMLQSNNAAQAGLVHESVRNETRFESLLLRLLGVDEPTSQDLTLVRLVALCWYGLLTQALNSRRSLYDVAADIDLACRLLLAPWNADAPQGRLS